MKTLFIFIIELLEWVFWNIFGLLALVPNTIVIIERLLFYKRQHFNRKAVGNSFQIYLLFTQAYDDESWGFVCSLLSLEFLLVRLSAGHTKKVLIEYRNGKFPPIKIAK